MLHGVRGAARPARRARARPRAAAPRRTGAEPGRPQHPAVAYGAAGPAHLGGSLLRYPFLRPAGRLRAVRAAVALRGLDETDPALDEQSFGAWLAEHGQDGGAVDDFWDVVVRATLNARSGDASLALAVKVFRTGLLTRNDAADIGYAAVPLSALHGEPALAALAAAGVDVRLATPTRSVEPRPAGVTVHAEGGAYDADVAVVAVPHDALPGLLPHGTLPHQEELPRLGSAPIVNLHVHYDRRVTDLPFAAAVRSPVQWVFDRTEASGLSSGQHLAVSLSDAVDEIDAPVAALRERYVPELAALFPEARGARVEEFLVTRERSATFRQAPGTRRLRPGPRTAVPGLFVAGAWTDTGWPATMESAVRSGEAAAGQALAHLAGTADREVAAA